MIQRFLGCRSLGEGGKLIARDGTEAYAVARTQKCGWIFLRIEQAQWCATDKVPSAGRTQRINSRLSPTNPDRTGQNFFPRNFPARSSQLLGKTSQKWKSGNKSYAGDTILSRAVKTDDFARRRLRASGNVINVECELSVITDWNFEQAYTRRCTAAMPAAVSTRGYNSTNTRRQPLEHLVRRFSSFDDRNWVEKNRDACVSRCKLDNSGDVCASKLLKCAEDCIQYFLRRVLEALAHADNERGISKGDDVHNLSFPAESRNPVAKPEVFLRDPSTSLRFAQDDHL